MPVDNVDGPAPTSAPLPAPRTSNSSPALSPVRPSVPAAVVAPIQAHSSNPSSSSVQPIVIPAELENDSYSQPTSPPGCRALPEGRDNDSQASCEGSNIVASSPCNSHASSPTPLGECLLFTS